MSYTIHLKNIHNLVGPFQKCRVTEQEVHRALLGGDPQDQLVIAYNLVVDNKRIADESESIKFKAKEQC